MTNILLNLTVNTNNNIGYWRKAIDEAYELSKKLNIACKINYANNQYVFLISPTMSQHDIDKLKETKVVIGL